jgi:hypothetical protein
MPFGNDLALHQPFFPDKALESCLYKNAQNRCFLAFKRAINLQL